MLRKLGSRTITHTAYLLDGAIHAPLKDKMTARHHLYYDPAYGPDLGPVTDELAMVYQVLWAQLQQRDCLGLEIITSILCKGRCVYIVIAPLVNARQAIYE